MDLCFTEEAKRFLAEFYYDDLDGKVFKYGEQLVSKIIEYGYY